MHLFNRSDGCGEEKRGRVVSLGLQVILNNHEERGTWNCSFLDLLHLVVISKRSSNFASLMRELLAFAKERNYDLKICISNTNYRRSGVGLI